MAISKIDEFEKNNDFSVNVSGIEGPKIYISKKSRYNDEKKLVNLLLIAHGKKRHTAIKSFIRLLRSSNSKP